MKERFVNLSRNGKILFVTQMFRLVFGLYLVVTDFVRYDDPSSALTVLGIYCVLGLFAFLFVNGKKSGIPGILTLSVILILLNTVFTILALGDSVDAGLHDPSNNIIPTVLRYVFFFVTVYVSVLVLRENKTRRQS